MKRKQAILWAVIVMFPCVLGGCNNGAGTEAAERDAQVRQLKTALEEAQQRNTQLQTDVGKLEGSLHEAESRLA